VELVAAKRVAFRNERHQKPVNFSQWRRRLPVAKFNGHRIIKSSFLLSEPFKVSRVFLI
jgi:hypothetical protein